MPKAKTAHCVVELLDGSEIIVDSRNLHNAEELLNYVCQQIGATEREYFGLRFKDMRDGKISWLDLNKPLPRQLKKASRKFHVGIQFFPDTIHSLQDETTRYQFVLQTRENLLTGRWCCSVPTQALLASYLVQAEFGEYEVEKHGNNYLDGLLFGHCQDGEFVEKVSLFHKSHKNMSPSDADWLYLKTARKMVMYGMDVFDVTDADKNVMSVGVDIYGLHILHMNTLLHSFFWPVTSKIHHHGKELFINIKISDKEQTESTTIAFMMSSDTDAKRITKCCNLYKEFSIHGTIKKNLKSPQKKSACSHISTRAMTKEFERVTSEAFMKRFQNDGMDDIVSYVPDRRDSFKSSIPSTIYLSRDELYLPPQDVVETVSETPSENVTTSPVAVETTDDVIIAVDDEHVVECDVTVGDDVGDGVISVDDDFGSSYRKHSDVVIYDEEINEVFEEEHIPIVIGEQQVVNPITEDPKAADTVDIVTVDMVTTTTENETIVIENETKVTENEIKVSVLDDNVFEKETNIVVEHELSVEEESDLVDIEPNIVDDETNVDVIETNFLVTETNYDEYEPCIIENGIDVVLEDIPEVDTAEEYDGYSIYDELGVDVMVIEEWDIEKLLSTCYTKPPVNDVYDDFEIIENIF